MKSFTHYNPKSLDEAVDLLAGYGGKAKANAGGTDLLGTLKEKSLPDYPEAIINLKNIKGLDYVKEDDTGIRIGALAKLADVAAHPAVKQNFKVLAEAATSVATPQVRNMCTIGGNLAQDVRCWYYRYPRELGGPIMCLRKGGKICNAVAGDNRYHSILGAAALDSYPCAAHCPAGTNIPTYLDAMKNGHILEAAGLIAEANPLPAITGRVCPIFCEPQCNRSGYDEPVGIRCVERALGDYMLDRKAEIYAAPKAESSTAVAIVGSGPAGLSAAYYLRRAGYQVTVFEKMAEAGGMLLYSIPAYRLPKDVVKGQVRALEGMGIRFEYGVDVGKDKPLSELTDRFDAVFLAGGAWKERAMGIKGEQLALSGLQLLQRINTGDTTVPVKQVAVIGGGNVAIDVARTLRRLGATPTILYRRTAKEMPAFRDEVEKAREEGVRFQFLTLPTAASKADGKIELTCVRMKLGAPDASGRPQAVPKPGSEHTLSFNAVVKAIGEEPDAALLPAELRKTARRSGQAARLLGGKVFAGGDFLTGPSTVIQAVAAGREAARLITEWQAKVTAPAVGSTSRSGRAHPFLETTPRISPVVAPAAERVKSMNVEDTAGIALDQAQAEAGRCVNCGCLAVNPSDVGPALVALDAKIVTTRRTLDAAAFFTAHAQASHVLDGDELVREIQIPKPAAGTRQHYVKFTLRKPVDFAIISVAAAITERDGQCADARIVLGAVGPSPVRAFEAEELLRGKPISEGTAAAAAEAALTGAEPLSMNAYKTEIARTLVKRAILGQV